MSLATTALITVAQAGAHLKLDAATITSDTDLLESLILAATTMVEDYTGRAFITRTITETRVGNNETYLRLWKFPVTDVASITVDGTALSASDWTERLSIGRVYYSSVWETSSEAAYVWELDSEIVVVYDAGYGTDRTLVQALVPTAVLAVKMIVGQMYEDREGVKSHSVSGIGSVEYDPDAWMKKVHALKWGMLC